MTTKRIPGAIIQIDVEKEFPILKSKFVAAKTAQREIEWIWKQQSNKIKDLKAKIWDEWQDENGTIGKAYGYQIAKPVRIFLDTVHKTPESYREYPSQAHYILGYLEEVPNGRQGVVTIWNTSELSEMQLVPCCHTSTWNLDGGRLNCVLDQRSGDMPYGVPFNTTQYAELMIMMAKQLGVKPGILTHVIADAHIYANQMNGVALQLKHEEIMNALLEGRENDAYMIAELTENLFPEIGKKADEIIKAAKEALACEPHFEIYAENPKDFFSYTADECQVEDYCHMGKISFGNVAV
jgi:thymidylate synthase